MDSDARRIYVNFYFEEKENRLKVSFHADLRWQKGTFYRGLA
jgi:hypothetical protein